MTTDITAAIASVDRYTYAEVRHVADLAPDVPTLGVEVTSAEVAARCDLGNIDPQHGVHRPGLVAGPATSPGWTISGRQWSAVEWAALVAVATIPRGAQIVTSRADLDSVCGIAVAVARAAEAEAHGTVPGCHACHPWEGCIEGVPWDARVTLVGEADAFAAGPWPGPTDLPVPLRPWGGARASVDSREELAAINSAVQDRAVPLAERVRWALRWLLTGEEPEGYRARAEAARAALAEAVGDALDVERDGSIPTSRRSTWGEHTLTRDPWRLGVVTSDDGQRPLVSVVQIPHAGVLGVGYCLAPVVVARHPTTGKVTIAWWAAGLVDRGRLLASLAEDGWGGGATILGSPHAGTSLSLSRIVAAVLDAVAAADQIRAQAARDEAARALILQGLDSLRLARLAVDLTLALAPLARLAEVRAVLDEAPHHVVWEARTGAGQVRITRADLDRAQQTLAQLGEILPSLRLVASAPPSARERQLADRIAVLEQALAPFGAAGNQINSAVAVGRDDYPGWEGHAAGPVDVAALRRAAELLEVVS